MSDLAYDLQLLGSVLAATTYGGHAEHWAAADEVAHYTPWRTANRRAQRVAQQLKRLERRGWIEVERRDWCKYYRAAERIRRAIP